MSDPDQPEEDRRPTKQIPKVYVPAPASARALEQEGIITLVPCPACEGHGMVTVEKRGEIQRQIATKEDDEHDRP